MNFDPIVSTEKGAFNLSQLVVTDAVQVFEHARCIATEYTYLGEVVRRDVTASLLHGVTSEIIGKL